MGQSEDSGKSEAPQRNKGRGLLPLLKAGATRFSTIGNFMFIGANSENAHTKCRTQSQEDFARLRVLVTR